MLFLIVHVHCYIMYVYRSPLIHDGKNGTKQTPVLINQGKNLCSIIKIGSYGINCRPMLKLDCEALSLSLSLSHTHTHKSDVKF